MNKDKDGNQKLQYYLHPGDYASDDETENLTGGFKSHDDLDGDD
jgi:hypothetical protein